MLKQPKEILLDQQPAPVVDLADVDLTLERMDCYDGILSRCRLTDVNFSECLIYDTWMGKGRFYDSSIEDCDYRYTGLERSTFLHCRLDDCKIENSSIHGLTIDGINVEEAINFYKKNK